jgi:hypothetical protein
LPKPFNQSQLASVIAKAAAKAPIASITTAAGGR